MTIRLAGILIGLALSGVLVLWSLLPGAINFAMPTKPAYYAFQEDNISPDGGFSFDGPFGTWDYAQLQRGYQVYKQSCSSCHGIKYVAFRNLGELGYSEPQYRAEAASWMVPGIDEKDGSTISRPGEPTDQFPSPFANDIAAANSNGGAVPPDLSLITKARPDGTNYVYSLMLGYTEPTEEDLALARELTATEDNPEGDEWETPAGLHFNEHFYNINIAMAKPLVEGAVTYANGPEATEEQMAQDVAAFLTWTAEPSMIERKQMGFKVIIFLLILSLLMYLSKKQVFASMKKD